ncbi:MAG TPA: pitrilysin family protein [Pyrinomonadaceae bacterium]|nr:pitrilysin family protein [Pyrinomonadaceae bacterium]
MRNRAAKLLFVISALACHALPQSALPEPGTPRPFVVPNLVESKIANGLKVAVVQRKNVPLVTVRLLIPTGAKAETIEKAGLADLTAALAAKRTRTRTADQIAEQMEFLGGALVSGADWNSTFFSFTVTNDKLGAAMAILADVILNSTSDAKELELLRATRLDNLAADLKQPTFLANFVASRYAFDEHPPGGTPDSIKNLTRTDIVAFRRQNYLPDSSVAIFTGDVDPVRAKSLTAQYLGAWRSPKREVVERNLRTVRSEEPDYGAPRILVVDLPDSGQSSVSYVKRINVDGRVRCTSDIRCDSSPIFFPAAVMNSVLGGGYSSRLNQEIRIKRGLSYGAGSSFAWRLSSVNFITRTQTKDESAAEVAELVMNEINRISGETVPADELAARKLVINGDYSREFETTAELAETVSAIYVYRLRPAEMTTFVSQINGTDAASVLSFAKKQIMNGDFVIAGDFGKFRDDLIKRFPRAKVTVIESGKLDISKPGLQK